MWILINGTHYNRALIAIIEPDDTDARYLVGVCGGEPFRFGPYANAGAATAARDEVLGADTVVDITP